MNILVPTMSQHGVSSPDLELQILLGFFISSFVFVGDTCRDCLLGVNLGRFAFQRDVKSGYQILPFFCDTVLLWDSSSSSVRFVVSGSPWGCRSSGDAMVDDHPF